MKRDAATIEIELGKPLATKNVKKGGGGFGPKGDYIEGWLAISEANRIFGWDGWSYSIVDRALVAEGPREIGKNDKRRMGWGASYLCRVRVTVGEVVREDEGVGHGYDDDKGLAHESAAKEAVTDALKRALRSFGNPFGLALYDKSRENVGDPNQTPAHPPQQQSAAQQKAPPSDTRPLSQQADPRQAAPRQNEKVLSKADGEAIVASINACDCGARLDEFETALGKGLNAHAAAHPKIRAAIAERRAALTNVPYGGSTPFDQETAA